MNTRHLLLIAIVLSLTVSVSAQTTASRPINGVYESIDDQYRIVLWATNVSWAYDWDRDGFDDERITETQGIYSKEAVRFRMDGEWYQIYWDNINKTYWLEWMAEDTVFSLQIELEGFLN